MEEQTTVLAKPVRMLLRSAVVLAAMLLLRYDVSKINHKFPFALAFARTAFSFQHTTYKPLTEVHIRQFRMARYQAFALAVRAVAFERRVDAFAFWIVGFEEGR